MCQITNDYDENEFIKNSQNLINYFKHVNYLKIDNKPVFMVYHNYLIPNIDDFYKILNEMCIENGFNGIHLVLNSFDNINLKYKNFYINFNYKKFDSRFWDETNDQIKLDYRQYLNEPYHFQKNKIQTIVYDFNNKPRLCKPDNLKNSTICVNNTEMLKTCFTRKIIETYNNPNNNEIDKILLVNAFNEWGENMTFEPSDKNGYYNINLLNSILKEN